MDSDKEIVGPHQENLITNEPISFQNLDELFKRIFEEDLTQPISTVEKTPEEKRLDKWKKYLSNQDEIDQDIIAGILWLDDEIKGRKLAGVESPKLKKELKNLKLWAEKLVPEELLPEELFEKAKKVDPNDELTNRLIKAAKDRQEARKMQTKDNPLPPIQEGDIKLADEQILQELKESEESAVETPATETIPEEPALPIIEKPIIWEKPKFQEAIFTKVEPVVGIEQTPKNLLVKVKEKLVSSSESEISFQTTPEEMADYVKTFQLPLGAKIVDLYINGYGNELFFEGVVDGKASGKSDFKVRLESDKDGVIKAKILKLNLSFRARLFKGKIENFLKNINSNMLSDINKNIDPVWEAIGFRFNTNADSDEDNISINFRHR